MESVEDEERRKKEWEEEERKFLSNAVKHEVGMYQASKVRLRQLLWSMRSIWVWHIKFIPHDWWF